MWSPDDCRVWGRPCAVDFAHIPSILGREAAQQCFKSKDPNLGLSVGQVEATLAHVLGVSGMSSMLPLGKCRTMSKREV